MYMNSYDEDLGTCNLISNNFKFWIETFELFLIMIFHTNFEVASAIFIWVSIIFNLQNLTIFN